MKKSLPKQTPFDPNAGAALVVGAASAEAVATVDRLVAARLEWNLGHAAALAAGGFEHLARGAASAAIGRASRFARRAALRAAAGLVRKALHCEKLLLAGGEWELLSAVNAGERFVCIHLSERIS
jgi:hypothetical protein